jgi:hypothetical protein
MSKKTRPLTFLERLAITALRDHPPADLPAADAPRLKRACEQALWRGTVSGDHLGITAVRRPLTACERSCLRALRLELLTQKPADITADEAQCLAWRVETILLADACRKAAPTAGRSKARTSSRKRRHAAATRAQPGKARP